MAAEHTWTSWPSAEAVHRFGGARARRLVRRLRIGLVVGGVVLAVVKVPPGPHPQGRRVALALVGVALLALALRSRGAALRHDAKALAGYLAGLVAVIVAARLLGSELMALGTLWVSAVAFLHLAPRAMAVGQALAGNVALCLAGRGHAWEPISLITLACLAGGYLSRLDREARARTHYALAQQQHALEQERAARAAEQQARAAQAEAAILAERARIARDMHDVLSHSLSAQLVHLEVALLMMECGGDLSEIRPRVHAARRMANDGLEEAREALLALRGEHLPLARRLGDLARDNGAGFRETGPARPLAPEAAQAARRVVQEALTNARKHAPGNDVSVRLSYLPKTVEVEVCDTAATGPRPPEARPEGLASSGTGTGLRGMRERAELLGGTLEAGPAGSGFRVLLSIPA
ncbi:histidine kinase [Dactylosporangium sp. NPDC000555]|uniref:sensor histidine kinase n=1 Tax=Dactylosporangium sp. NPDC000555 TaxID=3154260 RepID=UPI003328F0C9